MIYHKRMKYPIVLTGMPGAGKTTIGKLLAKQYNLQFTDIDMLIEDEEGLSVSDIFAQKGESYFRRLEAEIIFSSVLSKNSVISLGGGSFENSETRDFLLKNSTVIYLKTSPEIIYERIKNENFRPLLSNRMSLDSIIPN